MPERFTVKVLVFSTGERFVIIVSKKTAIPHPESSNYLLIRRNVVSMNTLKKEANSICLLLNWNQQESNNSIIEFIESTHKRDIHGLWLYLQKSKLKEAVAPETRAYRWRVVQNYIRFLSDKAIGNLSYKDPDFKALCMKRDMLLRQMSVLNSSSKSKRKKGLDKKIIREVIEVSRVGNLKNPWIERDQLRNQLIVDMLITLGLRASELLKISTQDIALGTSIPNLTIKRVIDDPHDTRVNEPRVKTFGRILDLDQHLVSQIAEYLKQRRNIPGAKRCKYLFVSNSSGRPISYSRLRRIIESMRDLLSEKEVDLTPHAFRRTWNDSFREVGESLGISEEMITQSQNYLQGRTLDSPEAYKYANKHIEKVAREAHLSYQGKLFGGKFND